MNITIFTDLLHVRTTNQLRINNAVQSIHDYFMQKRNSLPSTSKNANYNA